LTGVVYGVVAVVVKMDDVGLHLTQTASRIGQKVGRGLVAGMPILLSALSAVGTVAMLWVGGHILLAGSDRLGWHAPYDLVRHVEDRVCRSVKAFGGGVGLVGRHRSVCGDWIGRRSRRRRTHAPAVVRSARSLLNVDVSTLRLRRSPSVRSGRLGRDANGGVPAARD